MSSSPQIDARHVRVAARTSGMMQLFVPYAGEISMRLRRHTTAALRTRIGGEGELRGVAIVLTPHHLLLTVAGTPATMDQSLEHGRLVRELATSLREAADEIAEPTPPSSSPATRQG